MDSSPIDWAYHLIGLDSCSVIEVTRRTPLLPKDRSIFHVSYSPSGGAGSIAKLLADAQAQLGYKSRLITASPSSISQLPSKHPIVAFATLIDQMVVARPSSGLITTVRSRFNTISRQLFEDGAVINLHWLPGAVSDRVVETLADSHGDVFWTLHDMRPLTGGCHFSEGCKGYEAFCGTCPAVRRPFQRLVQNSLEAKLLNLTPSSLTFIAPSNGIRELATRSAIGNRSRVVFIPNPLTDTLTGSLDQKSGGLRSGFMFVAADVDEKRKGLDLALEWWNLDTTDRSAGLTIVGRGSQKYSNESMNVLGTGELSNQALAKLFASKKTLLFASREDNAPGVISEALSQGMLVACLNSSILQWLELDGVPLLPSPHADVPSDFEARRQAFLEQRESGSVAVEYLQAYSR